MYCLSIVCQAQFVQALDTDGNGKLDYIEFVNAFQISNNLAGTHNQDYYVAAHSNATNSRPTSGASDNRAVGSLLSGGMPWSEVRVCARTKLGGKRVVGWM